VDEIKKVIEEYMNWLYPQPVEVLDIKDFRDYSTSFVLGNHLWEDMGIFKKVLAFVVLVTLSVGGYYLSDLYDDDYYDGCI